MITGLQAQLDKVSGMIDGTSAISLGDQGTGAAHRIAAFESHTSGYTFGSYFYGMALCTAPVVGLGIWGGSGSVLPGQTGSGGTAPHMLLNTLGNLGVGTVSPGQRLDVVGNINCSGNIVGASKSFDIPHPDPSKPEMRLRHYCLEGDDIGGAVMYRRQLQCDRGNNVLQMPAWFQHLTKDVICYCSPAGHHFGLSWAEQDPENLNEIVVGVSKDGLYNILITARRKDKCATEMCPSEVEYIPKEPEDPPPPFPPVS